MELDELHVRNPASGTPCHRDAVAGCGIRIARVKVDFSCAAGCQYGMVGRDCQYLTGRDVLRVQTKAARRGRVGAQFVGGDHIDGAMLLQQRDIRVGADLLLQCHLHRMSCGVGGMNDAALAMAAFAGQMEPQLCGCVWCKRYALRNQPFDGFSSMLYDKPCRAVVAQVSAGDQRIGDVLLMAVARIKHRGDTALGPIAGAVE